MIEEAVCLIYTITEEEMNLQIRQSSVRLTRDIVEEAYKLCLESSADQLTIMMVFKL